MAAVRRDRPLASVSIVLLPDPSAEIVLSATEIGKGVATEVSVPDVINAHMSEGNIMQPNVVAVYVGGNDFLYHYIGHLSSLHPRQLMYIPKQLQDAITHVGIVVQDVSKVSVQHANIMGLEICSLRARAVTDQFEAIKNDFELLKLTFLRGDLIADATLRAELVGKFTRLLHRLDALSGLGRVERAAKKELVVILSSMLSIMGAQT